VLPVDKGTGVTSFQVVAHLRRCLGVRKIGHGGTLDPGASGVLPILVGEATKLMPYLSDLDKEYLATVHLGLITDTQDAGGTIVARHPVPPLDAETLRSVLSRFVGEIRQVPPMYSAVHHRGRRLYELAREGVEVERLPRPVRVHAIEVESMEPPRLVLRVRCGSGTYIRTLAADIGQALGCGGSVERLVRTRVGPYALDQAVPWEAVRDARDGSLLWPRVLPADSALAALPAVRLAADAARAFRDGQSVPVGEPVAGLARAYGPGGDLLGVGRGLGSLVRPERVFHADPSRTRELSA
jgi:tRNA pseudouridine55 synthase